MMTVVSFLILLGVVVTVHECGHFIVARRNGVRVLKFSIGFGPTVWKKESHGTEFAVSAIPLGGYVKMAGENLEEIQNHPDEFASKSLWQRAKIVFAGPAVNILLAFLLMPFVFLIGTKEPVYLNQPAKVGWVDNDSPAQMAGMKDGDLIARIDQTPIDSWKELRKAMIGKNFKSVQVKRGENLVELNTRGDLTGIYPDLRPEVQKVLPGKPAERAGLHEEDLLVSVDGHRIAGLSHFYYLIVDRAGDTVNLEILRHGSPMTVPVVPLYDKKSKRVIIGIVMGAESRLVRYGPIDALQSGLDSLIDSITMTFAAIGKLITGKQSLDTLGGPIGIARMSGEAARVGLGSFIGLMAMISLQLGIFNLLPIPVLDGGWILLIGIEAVRGKALSKKVIQVAQMTGLIFLLALIVYVSINDVMKLFR